MYSFFSKILYPLGSADRNQLLFISFLTIVSAIFELLGIGLIIPILNIFVGNDFLKYTKYFYFLENKSKEEVLVIILIFFAIIYIMKFFVLRYLIVKLNFFSHRLYVDISKKFLKNYLYKNFIFHVQNNSSNLIRNIQTEASLFAFGVVFSVVRIFTEVLIFISICVVLIAYDTNASTLTIIFFSIVGYLLLKTSNYKLRHWGAVRQFHAAETLRHLQQAFGSIREVIINNLENIFLDKFHYHNLGSAKAGRNKDIITQMPRLIMELIGIATFILLILFLLNRGESISQIFVIVGVLFFAAIRLLPSVSKIVQSTQTIKFNSPVIDLVYNELVDFNKNENNRKQNIKINENFKFENINFKDVHFSYKDKQIKILNNINIKIKNGEKIGVIGKTGSGKSTFVNLFCGLLSSENGEIKINDQNINEILPSWQNIIGYVSQNVSIIDESILFNISLESDINKVNLNKINEVLKIVDLYDHIYGLPKNINERAGEGGANLSGGQCQRLGIARALYRDPSVIILDEATSSLDEATENFVLKSLHEKMDQKTIISISHRKNALKNCSKVIEIENKNIRQIN